MKTLRGYNETEIVGLMLTPLPDGAIKQHQAKSYLSQISPAYTRERLTEVFGLHGIGWGLDWDPLITDRFETQTSNGKPRYHFALMKATFWFKMIGNDEETTVTIPVTGHSDNDNIGDAMAGARTSAISAGAKELLFQLHVYKNLSAPPPPPPSAPPRQAPANGNGKQKPNPKTAEAFNTFLARTRVELSLDEDDTRAIMKQAGVGAFNPAKVDELFIILDNQLNDSITTETALRVMANRETDNYFNDDHHVRNAIKKIDPGFDYPPAPNQHVQWQTILSMLIDHARAGQEDAQMMIDDGSADAHGPDHYSD